MLAGSLASFVAAYLSVRFLECYFRTRTRYPFAIYSLHSPPAREHYQRRRSQGDSHSAASSNLTNRHVGMLYHCLQSRELYDAGKAYPAGNRASSMTAA